MSTPLYKFLKPAGTSFFCFPGSAEDISAQFMNSSYKMYFSKYLLLNFQKQNTGTTPKYFDFDNSFEKSSVYSPPANFADAMIESLRNYVANQEVVIRESRLNDKTYYYDTNALETTSEKIFWKWCKKLNLIDFEPAIPSDEYFNTLSEFKSNNIIDDYYFPEYLWKEREVLDRDTVLFYDYGSNRLQIVFDTVTNFREGDYINIYNLTTTSIVTGLSAAGYPGAGTTTGIFVTVSSIINTGASYSIIIDLGNTFTSAQAGESTGQARLVYNRLVQYIGEVNGISNVQEANRSYTEVYAEIPDYTGMTPDILFRTMVDVNYKPSLTFPIIPSQYQPEIIGAEYFNSPIVSNPQNYPGSYYGQFDTLDFTYTTATGDSLRRSGDYYGINGDINNPVVDGSTIDGVNVDFNTSHYVKMNIPNRTVTNFDQFNAIEINNAPPSDFEFNAILWYYTVEDNNGNVRSNLYGIEFLDHPDNNPVTSEVSLRFPIIKKLVANGQQDGTAYSYNISLNYNIINENPIDPYNPEAINSQFSMTLFNDAMKHLASINDSFLNIIAEQSYVRDELVNIKGLVYTQTDIAVINERIKSLEYLLRLYSTNQMVSSDTIEVVNIPGTPPNILLNNIDTLYSDIYNINTSSLYNIQDIIPVSILVPMNRSFLINVINDDNVDVTLPSNLTITLDKDLYLNQTAEINITSNSISSQNKRLNIYMVSDAGSTNGVSSQILLYGGINLPVFYNMTAQLQNSAYLWKDFNFNIDFNNLITLTSSSVLEMRLLENSYIVSNSIKPGDTLLLNNLFVGTSSVYDYSGQYMVSSVGTQSNISLDISSNVDFVTAYQSSIPHSIHSVSTTELSNMPYLSLNKGMTLKVTRVSDSDVLSERYQIKIDYIL